MNEEILSHSGKLLRPMITLLIAKALGEPNEDSLRYAAAAELLHNATLMHDDVTDQSSQRRGRPTVSALLGPSAAVLIGDFWLSKAVDLVVKSTHYQELAGFFTKTLSDLSEGELLQMEKASSADTSEEDYLRIINCKTAALFNVAGSSGAISVGASESQKRAAKEFSRCFGMAFQIKDDILDYLGTDELGKPIGVDLKEQKITLPLIGALRNSNKESEIREKIKNIYNHPSYCEEIRQFVLESQGIEYAISRLDEYVSKAVDALEEFDDSPAKDALIEIAYFNKCRTI